MKRKQISVSVESKLRHAHSNEPEQMHVPTKIYDIPSITHYILYTVLCAHTFIDAHVKECKLPELRGSSGSLIWKIRLC